MTKKRKSSKFFAVLAVLLCLVCAGILLPLAFGLESFYVESGSMSPAIPEGSMAYIEPVEIEEIVVGKDVLLFSNDAGTKAFMHRVINIDYEQGSIYTKGDAVEIADMLPTPFSKCRGRVLFSVPFLGYVAKAVNSFLGKAAIVLFCVIWIIVEAEIFKSKKKAVKT